MGMEFITWPGPVSVHMRPSLARPSCEMFLREELCAACVWCAWGAQMVVDTRSLCFCVGTVLEAGGRHACIWSQERCSWTHSCPASARALSPEDALPGALSLRFAPWLRSSACRGRRTLCCPPTRPAATAASPSAGAWAGLRSRGPPRPSSSSSSSSRGRAPAAGPCPAGCSSRGSRRRARRGAPAAAAPAPRPGRRC